MLPFCMAAGGICTCIYMYVLLQRALLYSSPDRVVGLQLTVCGNSIRLKIQGKIYNVASRGS